MGINYNVTPDEVNSIARNLDVISGDYKQEVNKIYESLENLNSNWKGLGATTYYDDINNLRQDIESIGVVIKQYSDFSSTSAQIYNQTDQGIADASKGSFSINGL